MGEAEKIDILSVPETPAAESETVSLEENFNLLTALIDRESFDLRGKVKKSKTIDKQVKKEILGYIDEALGVITNFKRDGFSNKLAIEAADYFDVLQEMGEEHIPGFEKQQAKYNGKIEAVKPTLKEEQPIKLAEKISDSKKPEQKEKPDDDKNKKSGEENLLAEPLAEQNKKNIIMKEKTEEIPFSNTLQEQLVAKKEEIEKVIMPDNPSSPENSQAEEGQNTEKAGEVDKSKKTKKKGAERISTDANNGKKPERIQIVDVAGEQRKAAEEKIMELEQKLETAYRKSKNSKHKYELTKPIKDEIFKMIQDQHPGWKGKNGEDRISGEIIKIIKRAENKIQAEEKERREKLEDLKGQVEENYKSLYENYINKGIPVPKEKSKFIDGLKENLRNIWPVWLKDKEGKPIRMGDFIEELKGKYRIEIKKEAVVEAVEKEDLPEAKTAAVTIEEPVIADRPKGKPADKEIKLRPASPSLGGSAGKSKIVIEEDFSSTRNESQQEESKKFREELEKQKEEQTRFENIQEKMKRRKLIAVEDARFAQDYLVRREKRIAEAEKKIAARIKTEEVKPVPAVSKTEKVVVENVAAKKEKPSAPERRTVEVKELDAKAVKEARRLALMEKYGIKNLEDLKKMGL